MKIRIVGPAFPLRGGIADFNEALSLALQKAGDDVALYSFYLQYPSFLFPGKTQLASKGTAAPEVKIHSTISSVNPLSWQKTAKLIADEKPDLVIVRFWLPFMGPALGTIARLLRRRKIPVIAITDNVIPHEHRPGDGPFTKYFISACDGFIAMSRSVLSDLSRFTRSDKKLFLPHPVYSIFGEKMQKADARKQLNLDDKEHYLLFFGIILPYKGLDLLLEAMADERIKKQSVKLIVAGEFYESADKYLDMIRAMGIELNVILHTQFIPKEDVAAYFCAADLVVQPYRHATQSGITQIAYHFERPMVVTNVGGLSEIVDHGKTGYVTKTEPHALAEAIVDYFSNEKEMEMTENVRKAKVRFSWEYFISGIKELYENIHRA